MPPSTLSVARVFRALFPEELEVEAEVDDLGAKAFAIIIVASMLLEPPDPEPDPPAPTASIVVRGLLPIELITIASVADVRLLLSKATAAIGLTVPLTTPLSSTIFFNGSSC